eukprot:GHVS01026989.1.p1 GENE.GHVS01026989.1~~GHVS01026989.1.p1  ORF type:complete len:288 (+),score=58.17 GHVS01026989.1:160-1023(+)
MAPVGDIVSRRSSASSTSTASRNRRGRSLRKASAPPPASPVLPLTGRGRTATSDGAKRSTTTSSSVPTHRPVSKGSPRSPRVVVDIHTTAESPKHGKTKTGGKSSAKTGGGVVKAGKKTLTKMVAAKNKALAVSAITNTPKSKSMEGHKQPTVVVSVSPKAKVQKKTKKTLKASKKTKTTKSISEKSEQNKNKGQTRFASQLHAPPSPTLTSSSSGGPSSPPLRPSLRRMSAMRPLHKKISLVTPTTASRPTTTGRESPPRTSWSFGILGKIFGGLFRGDDEDDHHE